jgi:HNH endonuclease
MTSAPAFRAHPSIGSSTLTMRFTVNQYCALLTSRVGGALAFSSGGSTEWVAPTWWAHRSRSGGCRRSRSCRSSRSARSSIGPSRSASARPPVARPSVTRHTSPASARNGTASGRARPTTPVAQGVSTVGRRRLAGNGRASDERRAGGSGRGAARWHRRRAGPRRGSVAHGRGGVVDAAPREGHPWAAWHPAAQGRLAWADVSPKYRVTSAGLVPYDQPRRFDSHRAWRHGARWQRWRKAVMSEEPCCRECGSTSLPAVVDHIVRMADSGAQFERANLQRLCRPCAGKRTARGE